MDDGTLVFACEHRVLADAMRTAGVQADMLCVDAPYSARTHAGHNGVTAAVNGILPADRDLTVRRGLGYDHFTAEDCEAFAALWSPLVRGWVVSLTDDVLAVAWRDALERSGRRAFQPVPAIRGMTCRLTGDGPSSWSISCMVARVRSAEMVRWGTLPGAYVGVQEVGQSWVGGKPVWLIRALVRDYSRPNDLIVDPTCGAGTLAVACRYEGRRAILADKDPAAIECTVKRLRGERTKPTRTDFPATDSQPSLFAGRDAAE